MPVAALHLVVVAARPIPEVEAALPVAKDAVVLPIEVVAAAPIGVPRVEVCPREELVVVAAVLPRSLVRAGPLRLTRVSRLPIGLLPASRQLHQRQRTLSDPAMELSGHPSPYAPTFSR